MLTKKDVTILAIESSCDETAAAVVVNGRDVLSDEISSQIDIHTLYGGVVPEIASRKHTERINQVVRKSMETAGKSFDDIDAIAVTCGPGLVGALLIGVSAAKALAFGTGKPLIGVHHIEGHISANFIADKTLEPPFVCLVVSGGHTNLVAVKGYGEYEILGTTRDDAAGEAFDKTAKLLKLGFPGGPAVERVAKEGDPKAVPLPRPLVGTPDPHFSFSGLKSAVMRAAESGQYEIADIAASFQQAVVDCLIDRTRIALETSKDESSAPLTALVVAGGVAANGAVRGALEELATHHHLPFVAPPLWLCTDNAAMIGWAGSERHALGISDPLDTVARPRWPLDPDAEKVRGAGVKA